MSLARLHRAFREPRVNSSSKGETELAALQRVAPSHRAFREPRVNSSGRGDTARATLAREVPS